MADINFEFVMNIENYKNIESLNINLPEYNVIIVEGENESGKTSLVTSIMEAHMGKSLTSEPLTKGKEQGFVEHKIKDKDGNPVIVKQSFKENGKSKFVAIDHRGITISKVSDFEQLLGKYWPITVQDFFNLAKTTPGRKEILDKYLIQLFTPEQRKRLEFIEANVNDRHGVLYNKRRDLNSKIKVLEDSLKTSEVSKEDEELLTKEQGALELHKSLQDELSSVQTRIHTLNALNELKSDLIAFFNKSERVLPKDGDNTGYYAYLNDAVAYLSSYVMGLPDPDILSLKDRITKGSMVIDKIKAIKVRKESRTKMELDLTTTLQERDKIQEQLDTLKAEKETIYKGSKLPNGIVIEDDGFTIDGFDMSDTQLSFSKVGLIFAEVMMNIMESNLLVMGNAGEYGSERLAKLGGLARKYNKTVILTRVVDNLKDIRVVGIVEDKEQVFVKATENVPRKTPKKEDKPNNELF